MQPSEELIHHIMDMIKATMLITKTKAANMVESSQLPKEPKELKLDKAEPKTKAKIRTKPLEPPEEPTRLRMDEVEADAGSGTINKTMPPLGMT